MVDLILGGIVLVLMGIGVIVVSMLSEGRKAGTEAKGGGVVMIGPIPIIFGSDAKWASIAMILALILVLLTLALSLV